MRWARPPRGRLGLVTTVLVLVAVGLMLNFPVPAKASPSAPAATVHPAAGRAYAVTWNGVDVSTAGTPSSALAIDFTQTANLFFNWTSAPSGSAGAVAINDARLQMFYFGFAVSTRDQILSTPDYNLSGHIPLSWAPFSVGYVLEGVYLLTASFVEPNGSTAWSENFYVRANAPLGFVAVIPIVLLVIAVYEVYALARSGRYAALGGKGASPPPSSPPPASPPPTPPPPTTTEPPAGPSSGDSPPAGGSS